MKLLLDTCTFLWIAEGSTRLSAEVRRLFSSEEHDACLSAVSVWEILVKCRLGRLSLPDDPARFVLEQRESHRIAPLPLAEDAVAFLPRLPDLHRDPFDRMLACQALSGGYTIVTPDPAIRRYPVPTAW